MFLFTLRTPKERVTFLEKKWREIGSRTCCVLSIFICFSFHATYYSLTRCSPPEFMSWKKCFSLSLAVISHEIRTKLCDCVSIFSMIPTHHHTLTLSPYPQQTHWPKFDPKKAAKNGCFYVEIIDKQMNIIGPCNRFQLFFCSSCFVLRNQKERKLLMHAQKLKMIRWFVGFLFFFGAVHIGKMMLIEKTFSYFTSHNFRGCEWMEKCFMLFIM